MQDSIETELLYMKEHWDDKNLTVIKNLYHIYKSEAYETVALKDLSYTIKNGDYLAILGPSGSGKSTLISTLSGLIKPTAGRIFVQNPSGQIDLFSQFDLSARTAFRRDFTGIIFQESNLFDYLTVEENIQVPLLIQNKQVDDHLDLIQDLLTTCGIEHRRKYKVSQLSGGEKQRVQVVCGLVKSPQILLADEPTGNLDSKNAQMIFELFKTINDTYNTTIISVSHDTSIKKYAKTSISIIDGHLVE